MKTVLMGLLGLPRAVVIASYINVPPTDSQLPGSSATSKGQFTMPMAVLPLLDSTLRRVLLALWVMPMRVVLSMKRVLARRLKLSANEAIAQPGLLDAGRAQAGTPHLDVKGITRGETPREQMSGQPGFAVTSWDTERRHVNPRSQSTFDKLLLEGS